ncbi:hypothetical protein [Bradyrhizobium sp. RT4b]|uniref:hypothetical protein n=1 Tax=unclassified Bradyrhizobium TaxID=2631580 RepID=UPI00339A991D
MNKRVFLDEEAVVGFCNWLGEAISGGRELRYRYPGGVDLMLSDARDRYRWPPKRIDIPTPGRTLKLERRSNLSENTKILDIISAGLLKSLENAAPEPQELFEWLRAIFVWGGVYTKRGNATWLRDLYDRDVLIQYWARVRNILPHAEDDDIGSKLDDLRSNAGTTKVHSLNVVGLGDL